MITLKSLTKDGGEQVFEVKSFTYNQLQNRIDAVDCDGDVFVIYVNDDPISFVYAMNSSGSTVGKYCAKKLD
jgi:hypothetical protein